MMQTDSQVIETNVRVFTRVRPLLPKEKLNGEESCIKISQDLKQIIVGKDRAFTFDGVFTPKSIQEDVFNICVKELVSNIFEGYNSTIFAYGQTGSGKTYTMGTFNQEELLDEEKGIVPRAVEAIFQNISQENKEKTKYTVTASFIEVYKEEVRDLLDPNGNCSAQETNNIQIREDDRGNTIVCGVYEHACSSQTELLECLEIGSANRVTGATQMNEHSSRSHCVFTVNVVQEWATAGQDFIPSSNMNSFDSESLSELKSIISGKFHFVDLAGSERAHKTGNVGDRFKESIHINSGLLALGNVISALGDPKKKKMSHIPYRESKITRILKDSLGGNARTLMICCISPTISNYDETVNALKYANRARNIRNKPIVNHDHTTKQLVQMQTEILALREQLSRQKAGSAIPEELEFEEYQPNPTDKASVNSKIHMLKLQNLFIKAKDIINIHIESLSKGNNEISFDFLSRIEEWITMSDDLDMSEFKRSTLGSRDAIRACLVDEKEINQSMKSNINKLKNDLVNNLDLHAQNSNQLFVKDDNIRELTFENEELKKQINSLTLKLHEYESRLIEQQRELTQYRRELRKLQQISPNTGNMNNQQQYNFSAAPQTSPGKENELSRRIKSVPVPFMKDKKNIVYKTNLEIINQRKIKSSPNVLNPEIFVSRFHAQSHFLMIELENDDEVSRPNFYDISNNSDLSTIQLEKSEIPFKVCKQFDKVVSDAPCKDDVKISLSERLQEALHTTDVYKKQIKVSQLKLTDANQKLRDLSINIRLKEQLIKDLVKSAKDTSKVNKNYEEKINLLELEKEQTGKEWEKLQAKLLEIGAKSKDNETAELKKIKEDYERKMEAAQKKLFELQKRQKETQKLAMVTSNSEKKVNELIVTVERLKQEQINMQKKLKLESDIKQKLEKDLLRDQDRIKQLEIQNEQQHKVLKRKQEEIVAANRKLRRGSIANSNENVPKADDQKKWLDEEVEKVIQYKKQIEDLEVDLKKREEIIIKRELLLCERSELYSKTVRDECSDAKSTTSLTVERDNLKAQKQKLEEKIRSGSVLTDKEERWVSELDEAIEVLDEAIQYKNECIQNKQEAIRQSQMNVMMTRDDIFVRLAQIGPEESQQLLMRYFDKVIDLRETLRKKDLLDSEKDMQIEELQRIKDQLQRTIERQTMEFDRRYTQIQANLEAEKQLLLHQMANNAELSKVLNTDEASQTKLASLQKELFHIKEKCNKYEKDAYNYKKTCREMKGKIREWVLNGRLKADVDLTEIQQAAISSSQKTSARTEIAESIPNTPESRTQLARGSISTVASARDSTSHKSYDPENYTGALFSNNQSMKSHAQSFAISTGVKKTASYGSVESNPTGNSVTTSHVIRPTSAIKKIDRSPIESVSTSIRDSLDDNMK